MPDRMRKALKSYGWILAVVLVVPIVLVAETTLNSPPPPPPSNASGPTIKDIMDSQVNPSGDFLFQSIQQIADDQGVSEKGPTTDADWQAIRDRLQVLVNVPEMLAAPGLRASTIEDRSDDSSDENTPDQVQRLLDGQHDDFLKRAGRLKAAAALGLKAVDAKDRHALLAATEAIDKACESCHLHYWYPKDKRAHQAAAEEGIIE